MQVTIDVDVDVEDVLEQLGDKERESIAKRLIAGPKNPVDPTTEDEWHAVVRAIRAGDQRGLLDLLSRMAWDQAGVTVPVFDVPRVIGRAA